MRVLRRLIGALRARREALRELRRDPRVRRERAELRRRLEQRHDESFFDHHLQQ